MRQKPRMNRAPGLFCGYGTHDEDGVAEWVGQIEGACAPILIFRSAQDAHFGAPLVVVRIGVLHLERDTGIAAMAGSGYGAEQRDLNSSAGDSEQAGVAVFGDFKEHAESELVNVEGFGYGEVVGGKLRYGFFHGTSSVVQCAV